MLKILSLVFFLSSCSQLMPTNNKTNVVKKRSYPPKTTKMDKKPDEDKVETPKADSKLLAKIRRKNTIIMDVREVNEFVNGHLKGAVHLDFLKTDFESKVAKLDAKKTYLLYCSGGRAGKAMHYFKARKIKVENLGTFEELKNRGAPVEGIEH